ncbi:hypothetical protein AMETH_0034 [Amycolatopsis methanolica 239]|uniref:Uncharacterized protein n=1 Tax=Amycolatopsis methanolica 239 TaxID=1068978 RepID=A0A076MMD0_AMYME|nr:hypothetical protein AMETH_0034 [Amycolatopsis methanolica 239]
MPLARISLALSSAVPAAEVLAYWRSVEADVAARGRLVAFLVEQLSGKDTAMTNPDAAHPRAAPAGRRAAPADTEPRAGHRDPGHAGQGPAPAAGRAGSAAARRPGRRGTCCAPTASTTRCRPVCCTPSLHAAATPGDAVGTLVDLANRRGGPDNIACVVADVAA